MPEVPAQPDEPHVRIARGNAFEGFPGPVGAAVVDVHDLVVAACRTKGLGDPSMERFEVLAFVEHRQNDRQRLGLAAHRLAPGSSLAASQRKTQCDASEENGPPSTRATRAPVGRPEGRGTARRTSFTITSLRAAKASQTEPITPATAVLHQDTWSR